MRCWLGCVVVLIFIGCFVMMSWRVMKNAILSSSHMRNYKYKIKTWWFFERVFFKVNVWEAGVEINGLRFVWIKIWWLLMCWTERFFFFKFFVMIITSVYVCGKLTDVPIYFMYFNKQTENGRQNIFLSLKAYFFCCFFLLSLAIMYMRQSALSAP